MRIQWTLLRWFLQETSRINLAASLVWAGYVLFKKETLEVFDPWPWFFIGVHGYTLAALLGRYESSEFAFLYNRGFTRDSLWTHMMLATVLGVVSALIIATLFIFFPLRNYFQEKAFHNPYYPILATYDYKAVWAWWIGYAVSLPVFHYTWIRRAQPALHGNAGDWLCAGFLLTAFTTLVLISYRSLFWVRMTIVFGFLISGVLLFAGWKLHRDMEVVK